MFNLRWKENSVVYDLIHKPFIESKKIQHAEACKTILIKMSQATEQEQIAFLRKVRNERGGFLFQEESNATLLQFARDVENSRFYFQDSEGFVYKINKIKTKAEIIVYKDGHWYERSLDLQHKRNREMS